MRAKRLFSSLLLSAHLIYAMPLSISNCDHDHNSNHIAVPEESPTFIARRDEYGECYKPGVNMDKFPKNCERLGYKGCYRPIKCRDRRATADVDKRDGEFPRFCQSFWEQMLKDWKDWKWNDWF